MHPAVKSVVATMERQTLCAIPKGIRTKNIFVIGSLLLCLVGPSNSTCPPRHARCHQHSHPCKGRQHNFTTGVVTLQLGGNGRLDHVDCNNNCPEDYKILVNCSGSYFDVTETGQQAYQTNGETGKRNSMKTKFTCDQNESDEFLNVLFFSNGRCNYRSISLQLICNGNKMPFGNVKVSCLVSTRTVIFTVHRRERCSNFNITLQLLSLPAHLGKTANPTMAVSTTMRTSRIMTPFRATSEGTGNSGETSVTTTVTSAATRKKHMASSGPKGKLDRFSGKYPHPHQPSHHTNSPDTTRTTNYMKSVGPKGKLVVVVLIAVVIVMAVIIAVLCYKRRCRDYTHSSLSRTTTRATKSHVNDHNEADDGNLHLYAESSDHRNPLNGDGRVYDEIGDREYNTLFGGKERGDYHEYNTPGESSDGIQVFLMSGLPKVRGLPIPPGSSHPCNSALIVSDVAANGNKEQSLDNMVSQRSKSFSKQIDEQNSNPLRCGKELSEYHEYNKLEESHDRSELDSEQPDTNFTGIPYRSLIKSTGRTGEGSSPTGTMVTDKKYVTDPAALDGNRDMRDMRANDFHVYQELRKNDNKYTALVLDNTGKATPDGLTFDGSRHTAEQSYKLSTQARYEHLRRNSNQMEDYGALIQAPSQTSSTEPYDHIQRTSGSAAVAVADTRPSNATATSPRLADDYETSNPGTAKAAPTSGRAGDCDYETPDSKGNDRLPNLYQKLSVQDCHLSTDGDDIGEDYQHLQRPLVTLSARATDSNRLVGSKVHEEYARLDL